MPKLSVVRGDITALKVDAIVNAANEDLAPGTGVCGAIFLGAGLQLANECEAIGSCETGKAVITFGYKLFAKRIIHAVAPIFHEDRVVAPSLLTSAYRESLKLAALEKLESIAFPCIGTGVYGFPKQEAAQIAVGVCLEFEMEYPKEIIFCCFEEEDYKIYGALLKRNFI